MVVANGHDQFLDIAEDPAAQSLLSEIAEEALDHVQPGCAGRGEVHVKARMSAAGPRRIIEATKRRWAAVKAAKAQQEKATTKKAARKAAVMRSQKLAPAAAPPKE